MATAKGENGELDRVIAMSPGDNSCPVVLAAWGGIMAGGRASETSSGLHRSCGCLNGPHAGSWRWP